MEIESVLKKTLRSLCYSNGWSYGVFWRFDQRNSMLLTLEDFYYEKQMGVLIDTMHLHVHLLGEGIIGQVAFTGKHRWMFSDSHCGEPNHAASIGNQDIFQDESEFHRQFSSGIKTIAVIPVESRGVLQFGSTQKILERFDFLEQSRRIFREMELMSSLNSEIYDPSGLFGSTTSSEISHSNYDTLKPELSRKAASSTYLESCRGSKTPIISNPFYLRNQLQTGCVEAQVILSKPSTSSCEGSNITSLGQQVSYGKRIHDFSNFVSAKPNAALSYRNMVQNFQGNPGSEVGKCFENGSGNIISTFQDNFTTHSKPCLGDALSQWFASTQEQTVNGSWDPSKNDHSRARRVTSTSSLSGSDSCFEIPFISDGNENLYSFPMEVAAEDDLFAGLGLDFGSKGLFSEFDFGPTPTPRKGLFSELGLEQILNDMVGNSSSGLEDQLSTSKRVCSSSFYVNNLNKTTVSENRKEISAKSQVSLWIDDSYSINAVNGVKSQPKKPEEIGKATRKRARPGESTRPRPKDRQQIQDRVKELREIIPNGAKCSIDALLEQTIKHMRFLKCVTEYADKLKQVDEQKLLGQEDGVVLKESPGTSSSGGGATWAFEVGDQTMLCPIIVEDLSPPGQMLIEMLCEERGSFLEIADTIRGFGLTILKGLMEIRESKIWSHFVVEANRHVTRMEIFLSLVQLLQQTATSGTGLMNYEQPPAPQLPISKINTLQCL